MKNKKTCSRIFFVLCVVVGLNFCGSIYAQTMGFFPKFSIFSQLARDLVWLLCGIIWLCKMTEDRLFLDRSRNYFFGAGIFCLIAGSSLILHLLAGNGDTFATSLGWTIFNSAIFIIASQILMAIDTKRKGVADAED